MMIRASVVLFAALLSLEALACKPIRDQPECMAAFTSNATYAYFPLIKQRSIWPWYRVERTRTRAEYAWIAEPGSCSKGKFVGNGTGFSAVLGSANLEATPAREGSLQDLLTAASRQSYWTTPVVSDEDEEKHLQFMLRSRVGAKVTRKYGLVAIYATDAASNKGLRHGNPTHMRMQALLPFPDESYECIVPIEHIAT